MSIEIASVFCSSPVKAASLVTEWNEVALQAIRDTRTAPTVVARNLAIVHTGIFDAWAAYDSKAVGTTLGGTLRRSATERTIENKEEAISFAAYRTLVDLFPTQVNAFDMKMTSLGYDPTNTSTDTSTAIGIGNLVAKSLLDFRQNDGSNQLGNLTPSGIPYADYTGYQPVNTPDQVNDINRWQPLRVSDGQGGFVEQKFLTPQWRNVTPFALSSWDEFLPPPPKTIESDPEGFRQQAQEIIDISANLTDKQKVIAEYWADAPQSELPPGHWNLFAKTVSDRDNHNLDDDVKLFFSLNNSMLDASIATWGAKEFYDSVRPVAAINELFRDQEIVAWGGPNLGTQTILGQDWRPYQAETVVTPPFAEHTSGHSAFSAAGAEIFKLFTGSDFFGGSAIIPAGTFAFEDNLPGEDITLLWETFTDAADEAGISRLYGGIHFRDGDINGRILGRQVATKAWNQAQSFISPTQVPESSTNVGLLLLGAFGVGSTFKGCLDRSQA
ncbi:vanadium-dependent haloperoxidase [Nodularia sphaerocarpa]|nr:vanadium-dependent haloperoxidase [Nodularia sphaerocarpa]MDB9372049.1 vanadium-dependent haloperoxidase [Nodularia sphaerocarpa CS-585]